MDLIQWLIDNKEWFLSGLGVFIFGLFMSLFKKSKKEHVQSIGNIDSNGSVTIQQASDNAQINVLAPQKVSANVMIVDLYEIDNESDEEAYQPVVELKLLNSGDEVAFVKEVQVKTIRHWDIFTDQHPSLREVSARYDLNVSDIPNSLCTLKIPHEIKPQETDQIEFTLSSDYWGDPLGLSLFLLEVTVLFNEHKSGLSSQILLHIPSLVEVSGSFFGGYNDGTVEKNKIVSQEILSLKDGVEIPEFIEKALKSWINIPEKG